MTRVGVVIAARNEADTVARTVSGVLDVLTGADYDGLVVLVDDGSTDGTADLAATAGATVIRQASAGQGTALRSGYAAALAAGATVVVSMDADGQHRPEDLPALLAPVVSGSVDVATGSRRIGAAEGTVAVRAAGIAFYGLVLTVLAGQRVTDPSCGYRALSASALARLSLGAPQFHTAEVLGQCYGSRLRVIEVGVTILPREFGVSYKPMTLAYATGFGRTLIRSVAAGRRLRRR